MSMRCAVGRGGTTTSHWCCWLGRSCWVCSRSGGEKMPHLTRPQVSRILRELLPHRSWTDAELLEWLGETQERNARAKLSHIKRRLIRQLEQLEQVELSCVA
jgi:hypothetical protein